jgi:ABC-type antimicrobial peptide transport system permease subunit
MRDVVVPLGLGIVLGLAGAVLTLAVATALAAYLPARRAARLDPMSALHDE